MSSELTDMKLAAATKANITIMMQVIREFVDVPFCGITKEPLTDIDTRAKQLKTYCTEWAQAVDTWNVEELKSEKLLANPHHAALGPAYREANTRWLQHTSCCDRLQVNSSRFHPELINSIKPILSQAAEQLTVAMITFDVLDQDSDWDADHMTKKLEDVKTKGIHLPPSLISRVQRRTAGTSSAE